MLVGYVGVAGVTVGWRYIVLTNVLADALKEDRKGDPAERPTRLRQAVLRGAIEADLPLKPEEVGVSVDGSTVTVRVRHVYRAFEYGQRALDVPITVERSLDFQ